MAEKSSVSSQNRQSGRIRVLVVEDVDEMLQMMDALIREMGSFTISGLARNGAEARLEWGRRRPDLVLLDEVLPGESSLDLLEELRQDGIPVVLMTSMAERNQTLAPGALARIFKPGWKSLEQDRERIERELLDAMSLKVKTG